MNTISLRLLFLLGMIVFVCPSAVQADDAGDAGAIRHLLHSTFDQPDAPLTVEPVTIIGDAAVVGWAQGDRGGLALMRNKHGVWEIVLCSGDALKEAAALVDFGLPATQAEKLAVAAEMAESKLAPVLRAKFSIFDGVVMMDEKGHHPTTGGHGVNTKN